MILVATHSPFSYVLKVILQIRKCIHCMFLDQHKVQRTMQNHDDYNRRLQTQKHRPTAQLKLTTASPIVTFSSIPNWITSLVVRIKVRRVWRYQRGNQIPYMEEEQTPYWPKEKVQKDKQRSTKHTYKSKDRVTRTPLKTAGELKSSGMVN